MQINAKKQDGTYTYIANHDVSTTFQVDKDMYVDYIIAIQTGTMANWGDSELTITNTYMLYEGTEEKPYEQYGASPSPDYPSEIETVKDNVEIDVVNKNLLNIANTEETTKGGITYSIKNGILKLNGTATANFDIQLSENIKIKKGKYIHSSNYIQSGLYISFDNLGYTMISATVGKKRKIEITEDTIYKRYFIWIDKGTVLNNVEMELQLEVGDTATDFVEHQSQTAIMPIQQEMLEGDYVADVEYHEWGKLVLTGDEDWKSNWQNTDISDYIQFYLTSSIFNNNFLEAQGICNIFGKALNSVWNLKKEGWGINEDLKYTLQFKFLKTRFANLDSFKSWIKSLYEAGTPVTIYYKLATTLDLELTEEQKTVKKQIDSFKSYEPTTNIYSTNYISPIFNVKAVESINYSNSVLQNQINQIQSLLNTTQTSAMLLENEVEDFKKELEHE